MPEKDGLQAIVEIMAEDPGAHILVLTSFGEDEKVSAAIKAGALGYLLKDSTTEELLQAIRSVHVGQMSLPQSLALKMLQAPQPSGPGVSHKTLTDREVEVLLAVARGLSNQEIAQNLSISPTTVRSHVSALLSKLQLSNRTQLAVYAVEKGLV